MANLVILRGNIGSIEELKQVGSDNSLLKFTLATTKRIKGEDKTTWHRCLVWGKTAEIIAQYFTKGSQIYVQGEIENGSYEDKDGRKVYTSEIIVREFDFCGSKSDNNQSPQNNQGSSQGSNTGAGWGATQGNGANAGSNNNQDDFDPNQDVPF